MKESHDPCFKIINQQAPKRERDGEEKKREKKMRESSSFLLSLLLSFFRTSDLVNKSRLTVSIILISPL